MGASHIRVPTNSVEGAPYTNRRETLNLGLGRFAEPSWLPIGKPVIKKLSGGCRRSLHCQMVVLEWCHNLIRGYTYRRQKMASRKDGIIRTTSADDIFALIYAIDQTQEILKAIKESK
jgi:hypothetical protein